MWQKIRVLALTPQSLLVVYCILGVIATVQAIALGSHEFHMPPPGPLPNDLMFKRELLQLFVGHRLTEYNNYLIFKYSWFHLISGTNLYGVYPAEHWDYYKYSPSFAVFMGLLAYLPDLAGLGIWNLLNVLTLYYAVRMLPFNGKTQSALLWFMAFELLTSIQNAQSNALMCGLILLAYGCMQHRKVMLATIWIVVATYIKVYGAIGFCLFLFYPDKAKFVLCSALWMVVMGALPLMFTSVGNLVQQYHNWADLLKADASAAVGMSVAGWLHTWFGLSDVKTYVTLAGLALFALPFLRIGLYRNEVYKLLMVAFVLMWMVIFNHKAESPTYIIAVAGVGLWYYTQPKATWRVVLLWLLLLFTSVSSTDLFPPYVRTHFIYPYTIKAVPCILVWCIALVELMLMRKVQKLPPERLAAP